MQFKLPTEHRSFPTADGAGLIGLLLINDPQTLLLAQFVFRYFSPISPRQAVNHLPGQDLSKIFLWIVSCWIFLDKLLHRKFHDSQTTTNFTFSHTEIYKARCQFSLSLAETCFASRHWSFPCMNRVNLQADVFLLSVTWRSGCHLHSCGWTHYSRLLSGLTFACTNWTSGVPELTPGKSHRSRFKSLHSDMLDKWLCFKALNLFLSLN